MMLSSAGVVPTTGKEILSRPLKPTQFVALMSSWVSVDSTFQVDSSITIVNAPEASTLLDMVKDTGLGVETV